MQPKVLFLEYIGFVDGISIGLVKVRAIKEWPKLTTLTAARSFHGLASFYQKFIKGFITIIECLKKCDFIWTSVAHKAFLNIKKKLIEATVLYYLDLSKLLRSLMMLSTLA